MPAPETLPPITWDVERFRSVAVRDSIPGLRGVDMGRSVVLPIDPGDIDTADPLAGLWTGPHAEPLPGFSPMEPTDINRCSLEEWAAKVEALVRDVYAGHERDASQCGPDGLCD